MAQHRCRAHSLRGHNMPDQFQLRVDSEFIRRFWTLRVAKSVIVQCHNAEVPREQRHKLVKGVTRGSKPVQQEQRRAGAVLLHIDLPTPEG